MESFSKYRYAGERHLNKYKYTLVTVPMSDTTFQVSEIQNHVLSFALHVL